MKPLQILMPMGGLGQRFRDAGYDTPKPLIELDGVAMFQKALEAYDGYKGKKEHYFVIRKDTDNKYGLGEKIKALLPNAKIKILDHNTGGAVETCMIAEDLIDPTLPLIIMDCDITFSAPNYFEMIHDAVTLNKYDGILLSFESTDPRYSYAKITNEGLVTETAEKKVISSNALMGAYFFTTGEVFLKAAQKLLKRNLDEEMKEYYVSLLYNGLINSGAEIGLAHGSFTSFGTPEELNRYMSKNEIQFSQKN